MLVLAAASVCAAVIVLVMAVNAARMPYQLDYEEGNILNAAVRIVHGMTPYPAPHSWPSVINPYGPVGYEMASWMVRLGGVQLTLPRMMVIGCTVLCCVFIGVIVWREVRSGPAAVAFGALFLSFGVVSNWMSYLRVDLIALAFSLAALAVLEVGRKWWWLASLLIVAGVFTKHTSLAAPAACVVWLWAEGERRLALKLAGVSIGLGLAGLAYMQWRTHGSFLFYMVGTHPDAFSWRTYFVQLYEHFTANGVLSALALVAVAMAVVRSKAGLAVIYFVFATLTTVTIGKAGSNFNHLMELSAALCVAAAVGWNELTRAKDRKLRLAATAMVLLLAATVANNAVRMQFAADDAGCEMASTYVRNFRGQRIIAENMASVVLAGKTLWISNPFVYTQLVKYGGWSDADLQEQLRKREIDMVVFAKDQEWSPGFIKALEDNYRVDRTFVCRTMPTTYVPKNEK